MNLDELTYGQIKEIAKLSCGLSPEKPNASPAKKQIFEEIINKY